METLIKKNKFQTRWYPSSVDIYKNSINIPSDTDENKRIKSNFAYSMQYIEYLEKQIEELKLSNVLYTMLYKSYIITGMGIIESLFVYILKSDKYWKQSEWREHETFTASHSSSDGQILKVETIIYQKVEAYDIRMDLDSMIKKVEKKNILTIEHSVFPALKQLRQLRNRVHIQLGGNAYDHDYNVFNFEEIQMMRKILYTILTTPELCNNKKAFQFINNAYNKYTDPLQD